MTELNNAWVMDDGKRKAFWATAHDLGLSEEETREALGLGPDGSTKAYSGTLDEAMEAVAVFADRKRMENIEVDTSDLGEAAVVMFSQGTTPRGWEVNFTVRANSPNDAHELFNQVILFNGLKPLRNGRYDPVVETKAPARESSSPKPTPSPSRESAPQSESGIYDPVKQSRVERIEVDPEGVIKFHVTGMRWPLPDHRGADVVAGLFSDDCWTQDFPPMALSQPGFYEPEGLVAKYGKKQKGDRSYWDVIDVWRV